MTIWDKIYKNYQSGGDAWATLSANVHPLFKRFVSQSNFELKHALDIGCGAGNYMKYLQGLGFRTDGIDSSETSVAMTKKLLNDESRVELVDMFSFDIPVNTYDLIFSISTIHHGLKEQVQNLIDKVYEALLNKGHIFITVPNIENVKTKDPFKTWNTFKKHVEIAPGTYSPATGPEVGLPHSFYTKEEAEKLFSKFSTLQVALDMKGQWVAQATK